MKLLKITKKGSLHFELNDGRIGVSYESGYVRVSTKSITSKNPRMYQINKQEFEDKTQPYPKVKRVKLSSQTDRLNKLIAFNLKNCK